MKIYKIVKLKERPDAKCSNNIMEGYEHTGLIINPPIVGECFYIGALRTSTVVEIIDEKTFKTVNSIYQYTQI